MTMNQLLLKKFNYLLKDYSRKIIDDITLHSNKYYIIMTLMWLTP